MGKKKSIALLSIFSFLLVVLMVMTFVSTHIPFIKGGVYKYTSILEYVDLDGDLEQGLSYTIKHSEDDDVNVDVNEVVDVLKTRLEELNYNSYKMTLLKGESDSDHLIRLDVENRTSTATDIESIIAYGEVVFSGGAADAETEIGKGKDIIKTAYYADDYKDVENSVYPIIIELTDEGNDLIYNAIVAYESTAEEGAEFNLKAVLGEDTDLLNTTIDSATFKSFNKELSLTGPTTEEDAIRFAFQMSTGGLEFKYEIVNADITGENVYIVTPAMGINADRFVKIAIGVSALVMMIALIVLFRGIGGAMAFSLLTQLVLQIVMLYLVPGIKVSFGSVLGIAFAFIVASVSSFVFASKIKTEYAQGKTIRASIKSTYTKTALTNLDAHIGVGVIALGLFIFANSFIKGFAITFGIGIVLSIITSILFSRLMVNVFVGISNGSEKFLGLKKEAE